MTKSQLRDQFRQLERNRPADEVARYSRTISERLLGLPVFQKAQRVGVYLALATEVQTGEIIHACWEQGADVCVPYYLPEKKIYSLSRLQPGAPLKEMKWKLREPEQPDPVDPATLDLILVPAMAFDVHGVRLGHGGGHYDRLLPTVTGYRLGLAFHEQVVDALPSEPHDEKVHAILTEQRLFEAIP